MTTVIPYYIFKLQSLKINEIGSVAQHEVGRQAFEPRPRQIQYVLKKKNNL